MTPADADALIDFMDEAWGVEDRSAQHLRIGHLIATDPGGAWTATDEDGTVIGGALALRREDLWGLSLLIVRSDRRSGGHGRALMQAAVAYGEGTRGGIILSSQDPRAVRTYWRAGYRLLPAYGASGRVHTPPPAASGVRLARWPEDRDLVDSASRAVRGAAHGPDIDIQLEQGRELLVHDGGGFLTRTGTRVHMLAAGDERAARELLETALHDAESAEVDFLDAAQDWAIDTVLQAGLELSFYGSTCVRGDVGPLRPYVPSGAYL
jgi:GNAT superfamily N-acetyltransferase